MLSCPLGPASIFGAGLVCLEVIVPNPITDLTGWILIRIHAGISHATNPASGLAWSLSVVSLTILARMLTLPLVLLANRSWVRMERAAPELAGLRRRYRHDKKLFTEETMKFYRDRRVNPLGGCLPIFVQIPVLSSVYVLLYRASQGYAGHGLSSSQAVSLGSSHVIGVPLAASMWSSESDLQALGAESTAKIIIVCSVLLSVILMFVVVRLRHTRALWQGGAWLMAGDAEIRKISASQLFIPLLVLAELGLPFALIIYCVTGNLLSILQQYLLRRAS